MHGRCCGPDPEPRPLRRGQISAPAASFVRQAAQFCLRIGKTGDSAIAKRTTRHQGYGISRSSLMIERHFGCRIAAP